MLENNKLESNKSDKFVIAIRNDYNIINMSNRPVSASSVHLLGENKVNGLLCRFVPICFSHRHKNGTQKQT